MLIKELQKLAKPLIIKPLKKLTTMAFRRKPPPPMRPNNYAFMNIALKIDIAGPGWQKVVAKVLNGIHGVSSFKMENDGTVMISGTVDPKVLLKRLGKAGTRATLRHWQYGECSSNMFVRSYPHGDYYSQGYGSNSYYPPQYGGNDYGHCPSYGMEAFGHPRYGENYGHYNMY